jgi:ComF family protein
MTGLTSRLAAWPAALAWQLLPGRCVLCEQASNCARDLCAECHAALPWLGHVCPQCALPQLADTDPMPATVESASATTPCSACLLHPPPYLRCIVPLRYATPVAQMIQRVKFANGRVEARVLGGLLGDHLRQQTAADVDLIVPVPLGIRRLLRRGHNQAGLLAHWVGRATQLPVDHELCRRTRATPAQSGLSRRARLRNLRGAFAVRTRIDGVRIAVVDDVVTTGATVAALSRALLDAGAAAVHVWAVARTLDPQPLESSPH